VAVASQIAIGDASSLSIANFVLVQACDLFGVLMAFFYSPTTVGYVYYAWHACYIKGKGEIVSSSVGAVSERRTSKPRYIPVVVMDPYGTKARSYTRSLFVPVPQLSYLNEESFSFCTCSSTRPYISNTKHL
jgi:hypothetical protein